MLGLATPLWVYALFYGNPYEEPGWTFILAPMLVAGALLVVFAVTRHHQFLRQVMCVALLAKLAATAIFVYMTFHVYKAAVDALKYAAYGGDLAQRFESTGTWQVLHPVWSNNFVYMVVRDIYIALGTSSYMLGMLVFALLGFFGQFLLYRAFCIGYPELDHDLPAVLIFLMPSVVFWSSAVGKDALILLFLGIALYGFARMTMPEPGWSLFAMVAGLAGTALVRPHVGGMVAVAMLVPYLVTKARPGGKGAALKLVTVPILLVSTFFLARGAEDFLVMDGVTGAHEVLERVGGNNNRGDSAFGGGASVTQRALAAPVIFFRPFPWEVRNPQSAFAAGEGLLLLIVCWKQRYRVRALLREWRTNGFTLFLLLFLVEFSIIFSAAITNFGLLARERVMALPVLLMLLCVAARRGPLQAEPAKERAGTRYAWPPQAVASK